jgi:hypothetical protein
MGYIGKYNFIFTGTKTSNLVRTVAKREIDGESTAIVSGVAKIEGVVTSAAIKSNISRYFSIIDYIVSCTPNNNTISRTNSKSVVSVATIETIVS